MRSKILGSLQKTVSKSRIGTRIAIKLRDQCNSVIGQRCKSSIEFDKNGEIWLAERVAPKSGVVVDVGANVGEWTKMWAQYMAGSGRAILFEPNPEAAAQLRVMTTVNNELQLEVMEKAVSDASGIVDFFQEADSGETSSLVKSHSKNQARAISVPMVTLDAELSALGIDRIDMLKIDAEGYDFRVLLGARGLLEEQRIGVLQFEYNAPWSQTGSTLSYAYQLLNAAGYQVFLLKAGGLYTCDPDHLGEFYRYSIFVAFQAEMADALLNNSSPKVLL